MQHIVHATFQGLEVRFTDDGWFDATAAAAKFGKRPVDWLRLLETKRYITALSAARGISERTALIRAKRNSGTWMHPKLAVRFAQWLDIEFAVWCDEQIDELIRDGYARITDAERAHWRAMLELDKRDETSRIRASFGSHLMLMRKHELPDIRAERERLATLLQPCLLTH
ncbi:MAG: KilA-N domain-containing protein [Paraburkholderia sp.]|nr:MAG: KilA-N domain-containing protein [Paraburkholderia sp.]